MAKRKRHSIAEIAAKLGEADVLAAEGRKQSEVAKALGISIMTFHRWRKSGVHKLNAVSAGKAGAIAPAHSPDVEISRIAEVQLENTRLRKLVTDLLLEKMRLEDEKQKPHVRKSA